MRKDCIILEVPCIIKETGGKTMQKARQRSLSMNDTQKERLKSLSKDLNIPESRIVNHLVALTYDNQVLKDLLIKLDRLPMKCTDPMVIKELNNINFCYESLYKIMEQEVAERINTFYNKMLYQKWCEQNREKVIKIAKTRWIDDGDEML